ARSEIGFEVARRHAIDANAAGRPVQRQRARQHLDAAFRGTIRPCLTETDAASDRSNIDDRSASSLKHLGPKGLAAQKYTGQVDTDDFLPLSQRNAFATFINSIDAGIVNKKIRRSVLLPYVDAESSDFVFTRDVGAENVRPSA